MKKMKRLLLNCTTLCAASLMFFACTNETAETEILSLSANPTAVSLKVGETKKVETLISSSTGANTSSKSVSFSSSAVSVASVDASGTITALAPGTADITSTIVGTDVTAKTSVTVSNTEIKGEQIDLGDGSNAFEITQNMTLSYPNTYMLKGFVYVTNNAVLTIEPGVVIKGDKASKATLIVERGGKIMAQGEPSKPIVFTSSKPVGERKTGDWGGVIILGQAKNNLGEMTIEGGVRSKHGGLNDEDNSGVFSYVRIEYAGIEYSPDNEINGLTLGSVGRGTKLDHIQVSFSGDDSFEWFGGSVNATHLIAYRGWDDDFDTDNGFSGKVQFGMSLRDPKVGDKSASNGFESDNNATAADSDPHTSCVFSNMSIFGPVADAKAYVDESGVTGSSSASRFQAALHLRRNTYLSIFNSVIAAFPIGLIIENDKSSQTQTHAINGKLNVSNCVMAGMVRNFQDAQYWKDNSVFNPAVGGDAFCAAYYMSAGLNNMSPLASIADLKLVGDPLNLSAPVMIPNSDSPLCSGATWANSLITEGFEKVGYIGAFSNEETVDNNWTSHWAEFDPQNKIY